MRKRIAYRDLAQVVLQDLGADIQAERSCTRDPQTEILHGGPTRSGCRHPDKEILRKRSAYRGLAQVVLQDLGAEIRTERSWTRDKRSDHEQVLLQDRSTNTLRKRSSYTDLAQVLLQDPAEEILTQTSCARNSHTVILHAALEAPDTQIPTQTSCTRDPHIVSASGPTTGSWRRDPEREILDKRPAYREILRKWPERLLMQKS